MTDTESAAAGIDSLRGTFYTLTVKRVRPASNNVTYEPDASVFDLGPAEKLQLVEDLWDDLAATPDAVPVHDWQKTELLRRKTRLARGQSACLTWEDVRRRVRGRNGR